MAHNLAEIGEKVAMMYTEANPWHNLGVKLGQDVSFQEAMTQTRLDFLARLETLNYSDGTLFPLVKAVVRDEDGEMVPLGYAAPGYEVIQYKDALSIAEPLLDSGDMYIASAGALGNGEVAWLLLRNKTNIKFNGSEVQTYLCIMTSHNRTKSLSAIPTGVYVVCNNTLNMVRGNAVIRIRHTRTAPDKIKEAKRIMASFSTAQREAQETYGKMAHKMLTLDELTDYWQTVFPVKVKASQEEESREVVADLLGTRGVVADLLNGKDEKDTNAERIEVCQWLLQNGKGQDGTPSLWHAYNTVTEYVDHIYPNRQDGMERKNGMQSSVFGGGSIIRDKAWGAALARLN